MQLLSEWAWLSTHQTMFIDTDSWISYNFYLSKNMIFLLIIIKEVIFFNYLKYKKIFSAPKLYKKQTASRIWPADQSFLMALLKLLCLFSRGPPSFLLCCVTLAKSLSLSEPQRSFFFALNLFFSFMRYNWPSILYMFKVDSRMIWLTYILKGLPQ